MSLRFKSLFTSAALLALATAPVPARAQGILEKLEQEMASIVRQARGGVVSIEDARTVLSREETVDKIAPGKPPGAPLKGLKGYPPPTDKTGPAGADKDGKAGGKPSAGSTIARPSPLKSGTGFSIGDGYIVTTADVLDGMPNPLVVTDSGVRFKARIVEIDDERNIGLLALPPKCDVPPLPLGSSSSVAVGHFAISMGNQNGQINSVGLAVVSGLKAAGTFSGSHFYTGLIQIAGTVGAGSSGAPLLNSRGEVIGMLAAVPGGDVAEPRRNGPAGGTTNPSPGKGQPGPTTDPAPRFLRPSVTSAGFAIPIDDLKQVIEVMRNAKFYGRAWVGIDLKEIDHVDEGGPIVRVTRTVWVEGVYPESPAARAGLKPGDQIVSLNGQPVHTLADFRSAIVRLHPGDRLTIEVLRQGSTRSFDVPFETRPPVLKQPAAPGRGKGAS